MEIFAKFLLNFIFYINFFRLYHQLTDLVEELLQKNPSNFNWLDFSSSFLTDVWEHLNQIRYSSIIVKISSFVSNSKQGIEFLQKINNKIKDPNSKLLLNCQEAFFEISNNVKKCKNLLEHVNNEINNSIKMAPSVLRAHYHFVSAKLYKV